MAFEEARRRDRCGGRAWAFSVDGSLARGPSATILWHGHVRFIRQTGEELCGFAGDLSKEIEQPKILRGVASCPAGHHPHFAAIPAEISMFYACFALNLTRAQLLRDGIAVCISKRKITRMCT